VTAPGSRYLVPTSAALALALSSTALCGVLDGFRWLWPIVAAIALVLAVGLGARQAGAPTAAVSAAQVIGLTLLLTGLFGQHAVGGLLPTGSTLRDLGAQLGDALSQIETGVPPVATTQALCLLVALGFGVVMVVIDPLVMAGHGPAVGGLVLLGGYTVPTALAPDALPGWTLVAGGAGYALHLMLAHRERLARRGILAEPVRTRQDGPLHRPGDRLRTAARAATGLPVGAALTALALAVALGLSSLATFIGTDGRFAGNGRGDTHHTDTQFGLNPFTTLQGELTQTKPKELLRVRGLPSPEYLRAVTLTRYVASDGWQVADSGDDGVSMNGTLPVGPGAQDTSTATVQFQNVGYKDRWLPLFGLPLGVTGLTPDRWHYDVLTSSASTSSAITEPSWIERAALPDPGIAQLEQSQPVPEVDPSYLDVGGVTSKVTDLARAVTRSASTPFAKAVALNRYFLDPANGYRYDVRTRPGNNGDALEQFLFRGKVGYCEQYASAMAVMLRSVGVPARVAIGFTAGQQRGDFRSITTADAHAWVEGYLAGSGWLPFDPTPLGEGRSMTPSYVSDAPPIPINVPPSVLAEGGKPDGPGGNQGPPPPPAGGNRPGEGPTPKAGQQGPGPGQLPGPAGGRNGAANSPGGPNPESQGQNPAGAGGDNGKGGANNGGTKGAGPDDRQQHGTALGSALGWILAGVGLIALLTILGLLLVGAVVATPAALRGLARRRRMASAARGGVGGAEAAWREVLAEFQDRGTGVRRNDTVRASASRLVGAHGLAGEAVTGMRTVVSAVERGWYGGSAATSGPGRHPDLVAAVDTVRGALEQRAPLSLGARILPRSVLPALPRLPRRERDPARDAEPYGGAGWDAPAEQEPPVGAGPFRR
jgi:transglutaminase-like putative cysteine protease